MKWYRGYKYVVAEKFKVQTAILTFSVKDVLTELEPNGILTVNAWYAWDGNSGPCVDTISSMEASCVHDVLCDYINMGWLPQYLQPIADQEYYILCTKKGMWWRRARARLLAIRWYMTGKGAKRFRRSAYHD